MNIRFIIFSIIIFLLFVTCVLMHLPDTIAAIVLIALMIYGFSNILKNILETIQTLSLKDFSNLTQWLFSPSFVTRSQLKNLLAEKKTDLQKKEQELIDLQNEFEQERVALQSQNLLNRIGLAPHLDFSSFDPKTVLHAFFLNLETYLQIFMDARIILSGPEWLRVFEFNCLSSKFPFSTDELMPGLREYKVKFAAQKDLYFIDAMEGHAFEYWCADFLDKCGFANIKVTKGSGDQGVDIVAEKDNLRYAIQCKRYSGKLSNKPIQEVNTGKAVYGCDIAVVMTNSYFTSGAEEAARANGVLLWDKDEIKHMIENISIT